LPDGGKSSAPEDQEAAMLNRKILAMSAAIALAGATPLLAHHGWSGYDSGNVLTLDGALATVAYQNPHVTIELKTADKTWEVVLAPPFRMTSRGLPEGSLKVGDTVTVVGYPHKTETSELRAERIVVAGKTVELR
jgi:hypothetical protein